MDVVVCDSGWLVYVLFFVVVGCVFMLLVIRLKWNNWYLSVLLNSGVLVDLCRCNWFGSEWLDVSRNVC